MILCSAKSCYHQIDIRVYLMTPSFAFRKTSLLLEPPPSMAGCKTFLEMTLAGQIGKITELSSQNALFTGAEAKSVRLDIFVKDENGKTYDIEMQAVNEFNLPKRMRYYQAAIDIMFLDKGEHYSGLNDSYIIFLCLFDSIGKDKPVYTFENVCLEDRQTLLNDGTKKIIINANAFKNTEDKNLSGFLEYVKTGKVTTEFTGRIEKMIEQVKNTEQARSEYRFISGFEMDARHHGRLEGRAEGMQAGILQGRSEGIAQGSYQKSLETAKILKQLGDSTQKIIKATGLSREEIEKL